MTGVLTILGSLAMALASAAFPTQLFAERPHIVVFLSDDHTLADCSVYGAADIETPQMERLAASGMAFDLAFVASPSCAPSRAALLTGLMPARNGAEANHSPPGEQIKKLPAYLKELGYEVAAFGKVGHYAQTPEYGFDVARHFGYHEDVAVGEAIEWLKARESEKPLCLFVGTNWPHVPWAEPVSIDPAEITIPPSHVHTPATRKARAKYYQSIRTMDDELGQVFDAAYKKLGENTLFVHSSDHGAQWPFAKWTLYDAGIRTPLIVSWPGRVARGVRSDAMVSWVDLLPTLVEAAGGTPGKSLDGHSFLPVLTGQTADHREAIFTTHSGDGNFNVYPARSVRDKRFKYILNLHPEFAFHSHVTKSHDDEGYWASWVAKAKTSPAVKRKVERYQTRPAEELYDLQRDPHEQRNLADQPEYAERLAEMRKQLDRWMVRQDDQRTVYGMPQLITRQGTAPNVVMVFIDDMGWADLSCFGGTDVTTEHIDRLANEGIRFTNFYVNSPICSPSRAALTTGNYPARHRITSYLAKRELNDQRGMAQWLDSDAVTLPRMLAEAGYRCGHFGKWHLGGQRDVGEAPLITAYGFDTSLTNFEGLGPRLLPLCDAFDGSPVKRHDLGSADLGQGPIEWVERSQITSYFVDSAIEFIDESVARKQPFYINVWPDDVHSPFFPPEARRDDASKRSLYLAVLKTMDEQLGVLFDRIESDQNLRENTLVLLCSDNGHEPGAGSSGPLRGAKGNLYEGGVRSPLIAWGPGLIEPKAAGTVNETTILSSIDLVASLVNLCRASPPEEYRGDGEDLLAALLGKSTAERSRPLFWRRPPDRPGPKEAPFPDLAIRDGDWKLLCDLDGTREQLYNLRNDLSEQQNLAAEKPQITRRLKRLLLQWNATLPVDAVR
ncbi:sulfatase-like hydrolase/transferase [Candidatus Laterigemmans baculatus]|uniref:sulfatase-like hydrolase/transferase n=1 Tax=Candidatus Laterigemmans baculatus TaxID=2770505 RepID=UPI0013DC524E|nr:sulfatase-like hydrolase/transferase [Candidatus Laterigemmans baculatus]